MEQRGSAASLFWENVVDFKIIAVETDETAILTHIVRWHSFFEVIGPAPLDVHPAILQKPLFVVLGKILSRHLTI